MWPRAPPPRMPGPAEGRLTWRCRRSSSSPAAASATPVSSVTRLAGYLLAEPPAARARRVGLDPAGHHRGPEESSLVQNYPVIVLDGCGHRCGSNALNLVGIRPAARLFTPRVRAESTHAIGKRRPFPGARARRLAKALAHKAAAVARNMLDDPAYVFTPQTVAAIPRACMMNPSTSTTPWATKRSRPAALTAPACARSSSRAIPSCAACWRRTWPSSSGWTSSSDERRRRPSRLPAHSHRGRSRCELGAHASALAWLSDLWSGRAPGARGVRGGGVARDAVGRALGRRAFPRRDLRGRRVARAPDARGGVVRAVADREGLDVAEFIPDPAAPPPPTLPLRLQVISEGGHCVP